MRKIIMKTLKFVKSHFGKLLVGLGAICLIYLIFFKGNIHFKEEIQLSSGEVIIVDRKFVTTPLGEIGGSGGWVAKYNSFEIVSPDRLDNPPIWESNSGLIPVLFDRDPKTNEWFLVTSFFMCSAWESIGKPKHPYAEFRVKNGQWHQVALSPDLFGRATNVYVHMRNTGEFWLVHLELKALKHGDASPEYKNIVNDRHGC
jgi:hypothetical protein